MFEHAPQERLVRSLPSTTLEAFRLLLREGCTYELRALDVPRGGWNSKVEYGYFTDFDAMARAADELSSQGARAVYYTANPVNPDLLARCANRTESAKRGSATADVDVVERHWLLVDVDPRRPSGISSTNEELAAAMHVAKLVFEQLTEAGWPEPIVGCSGNGAHLMWRVAEPNDDATTDLFSRVLGELGRRFDTAEIIIDRTVFNAARIWKVPFTCVRKGDNIPTRPHRRSELLYVPDTVDTLTRAQLEAFVPAVVVPVRVERSSDAFDLGSFVATNFPDADAEPYAGGRKWVLPVCPFNSAHDDKSAVIIERPDGAIGFRCHHNGCTGRDWRELRSLLDPGYLPPSSVPEFSAESIDAFINEASTEPRQPPPGVFNPKRPDGLASLALTQLQGTLIFWRGAWHRWTGTHWQRDDTGEAAKLIAFNAAARAFAPGKDDEPTPYPTTRTAVSDIVQAMERLATVLNAEPNKWLQPRPGWPDHDTVSTPSGLYNIGTGELIPHDKSFMATASWAVTPAPGPMPTFDAFLASCAFAPDEILALQEQLGLLLGNDTKWQKVVLLLGLERSGKGTISWLILNIIGQALWGATSPKSLGELFGLQALADCSVAYVGDVRDWRGVDAKAMTERILQISGEDHVQVRRMHTPGVTEKLRCRFLITTNETPRFDDPSGVIASRHLITRFRVSHLGREDYGLKDRLRQELPAIAAWALQGLHRVRLVHHFTETAASLEVKRAIREAACPMSAWVEDCLELRPELRCGRDSLYKSYCDWAQAQGHARAAARTVFQHLRDRHGCIDGKSKGLRFIQGVCVVGGEVF